MRPAEKGIEGPRSNAQGVGALFSKIDNCLYEMMVLRAGEDFSWFLFQIGVFKKEILREIVSFEVSPENALLGILMTSPIEEEWALIASDFVPYITPIHQIEQHHMLHNHK